MLGDREFRRITDDAWNADVRLAAMDRCGVDRQVLSPTPVFFSYDQPAGAAAATAAILNDLALDIAAQAPQRLVPFCQVPLQDTDAACRELDRALDAGHRGVEIGNHVGDRDLDDAGIVTFLQHCADRRRAGVRAPLGHARHAAHPPLDGAVAHRHARRDPPLDPRDGPRRRVRPGRRQACGSASPTAAARSRSGSGASRTPGTAATTSSAPRRGRRGSTSAGSASTPPCSTPSALRLLVDTLGAEHVLLGSDYPYPLGEAEAGRADPHVAAAHRRGAG